MPFFAVLVDPTPLKRDSEDALRPEPAGPPHPPAHLWGSGWTAEGVISVLDPLVTPARRARILEVVNRRIGSVTLLMDAPHDPHNGAAVVRSCDAFGIQQLHVVERSEPFLISSRVAQGAERWVDVVTYPVPEAALAALRGRGFTLVASHPQGSLEPDELSALPRLALVVGNEHDGICEALRAAAELSVRIPMRGFVESLNVSVSAALLLLAATRTRAGDLSEDERRLLYARGLFRTVPRAADVLDASAVR